MSQITKGKKVQGKVDKCVKRQGTHIRVVHLE